jgi:fucose 4-O-acetylase-like acetyltransferase
MGRRSLSEGGKRGSSTPRLFHEVAALLEYLVLRLRGGRRREVVRIPGPESQLSQTATTLPSRDPYLDCLKGFAIVTVVLGHTFQGATADFDHYLPFRLVYAFHMPMFMFVAGMTASLGLLPRLQAEPNFPSYLSEIRSKALRLVLPFITWTVIAHFIAPPEPETLQSWLWRVLQSPDYGLWFLWILFQCGCVMIVVTIVTQYAVGLLAARMPDRANEWTAYLILILVGLGTNSLIHSLPNALGFGMTKVYFIYFFTGAVFHSLRPKGLPNVLFWASCLIFAVLAPFWYRIEMSPVALLFPKPGSINPTYLKIVAFAGTFAFVELVRLFVNKLGGLPVQTVAFVGKRSLDIYAIHFYFLAYFPPVIAPLVISLGASFLLRTNALTSWLCFGQKPSGIWRRIPQHLPESLRRLA